jgi:hypothetical protein
MDVDAFEFEPHGTPAVSHDLKAEIIEQILDMEVGGGGAEGN